MIYWDFIVIQWDIHGTYPRVICFHDHEAMRLHQNRWSIYIYNYKWMINL
jgi:hypothetical protein